MDPHHPTIIMMEHHRNMRGPLDAIQFIGTDEGAMSWNTTADRLLVAPLNSFGVYTTCYNDPNNPANAAAGRLLPKFVASNQFSVVGE